MRVRTPDPQAEPDYNPWASPRPEYELEKKKFGPFWVYAKPLDAIEIADVMGEAQRLTQEYCGDEDGLTPDGEPADGMLGPDGETYVLNSTIIHEICFMRGMEPEERRRSFSWWVGVATRHTNEFKEASIWVTRIQKAAFGGNFLSSGSSTTESFTSQLTPDKDTPSSNNAPMPSPELPSTV
jgi:hypothetical protein